jgi:hypothetical protein
MRMDRLSLVEEDRDDGEFTVSILRVFYGGG